MDLFERIPLITKRLYDFTAVSASSTLAIVAIKRLDLTRWRQMVLELRVHSKSVATGTILVRLVPVSFTRENPGVDFVDSITTPLDLSITSAGSTPDLLAGDIAFAGGTEAARLVVQATQGASGALSATISVDAVLKARL